MEKLNVLYMCNNSFAGIAGISLTSLFMNNRHEDISITVYLLLVNVSDENQRRFNMLARQYRQTVHLIDCREVYKELQDSNIPAYRGSSMTNLRLYFDQFIPKTVERLLYLDSDTLVCSSVQELVHFNMQGKMLGMVFDAYGRQFISPGQSERYYNAGVLLIDCNQWRTGHWHHKIMTYMEQNTVHFTHPDQDIFNIICREEIITLPMKYNFQTVHRIYSDKTFFRSLRPEKYYSEQEISSAREKPAILHMIRTFGCNPWNSNNTHPDTALFLHYKEISLWRDMPEFSIKKDVVISIERILYKILPSSVFLPLSLFAIKLVQTFDKSNKY